MGERRSQGSAHMSRPAGNSQGRIRTGSVAIREPSVAIETKPGPLGAGFLAFGLTAAQLGVN